jgi:hypothetical protein
MLNKPCKTFLCHYHHDGSEWAVDITAYDLADAEARVKKLGNLKLDGELIATYPVEMGWWCKLTTAIRNFFWR